jgi:hypothetical protein
MIVKSIDVGDVFLSVTGNRWTITEIGCEFDGDENRWETSIKYNLFDASGGVSYQVTEKARVVVQSLNTDAFYTQVRASGDVTQSVTIKPTGNSVLQNDFIANAARYGMSPSDLGRTAILGGSKYQIVGAKPGNRTKPIMVEGPSGGLRRATPDDVKAGLELFNSRKVQMK